MWSQPSDFDRVREWGVWCNLNREETDGQPIERHLWDLRTTYAMGGELFNSFNWHLIGPDAYFNYAREFIANLPSVTLSPRNAVRTNPTAIHFTPPDKLQAFSRIVAPVKGIPGRVATVALSLDGGPGRTWFSLRQSPAKNAPLTFEFPAPAEANYKTGGVLRLHAYDANGAELRGAAAFADDAAEKLRLTLDMEESRALSRLIIGWRQAKPAGKFSHNANIRNGQ
jgi:hypothetical protein